MRTPVKHSTDVESAPSVVSVPTVISRSSLTSSTADTSLPTNMRNPPVRLVCFSENSPTALSDALISVPPPFTIFPSPAKIPRELNQYSDRPIFVGSSTHTHKKTSDFDHRTSALESNITGSVTILTPTKTSASSQLMSLVQNSELKTFVTRSSGNNSSTMTTPSKSVFSISSTVTGLPIVTISRTDPSTHGLMSSLTSYQSESIQPSGHHISTSVLGNISSPFKAAGLVSHSTLPVNTSAEVQHQQQALISVHQDLSKNSISSSLNSSIRPSIPIASSPNRTVNALHSSSNHRQQTTIAAHTLASGQNQLLTPNRKRARKQQLLAPHGSESPSKLTAVIAASTTLTNSAILIPPTATSDDIHVNMFGMSTGNTSVACSRSTGGEPSGTTTTTATTTTSVVPKVIGKGFLTCQSNAAIPSYSFYTSVTATNQTASASSTEQSKHPLNFYQTQHANLTSLTSASGGSSSVVGIRLLSMRPQTVTMPSSTPSHYNTNTLFTTQHQSQQPTLSLVVNSSVNNSNSNTNNGNVNTNNGGNSVVSIASEGAGNITTSASLVTSSPLIMTTVSQPNQPQQSVYVLPSTNVSQPRCCQQSQLIPQPNVLAATGGNTMMNLGGILQVRFRNSTPSSSHTATTILGGIVGGTPSSRLNPSLSSTTQTMQRCFIEPINSQQLTVVNAAPNLQVRPVPLAATTVTEQSVTNINTATVTVGTTTRLVIPPLPLQTPQATTSTSCSISSSPASSAPLHVSMPVSPGTLKKPPSSSSLAISGIPLSHSPCSISAPYPPSSYQLTSSTISSMLIPKSDDGTLRKLQPAVMPQSPGPPTFNFGLKSDASSQPAVPILRVPDPNSRHNRYEDFSSPCKRPRKQAGGKSQCWELRTDPTDSSKCIWRAPERMETNTTAVTTCTTTSAGLTTNSVAGVPQTVAIISSSKPEHEPLTMVQQLQPQSSRVVDGSTWENAEWVIHGCPARMHLCKPSHFSTRSSGCWKGAKAGHFLKFSEIRHRQESVPSRVNTTPSDSSGGRCGNDRRRRLREQGNREIVGNTESAEVKNPDYNTLMDLLELRNQHLETSFINHPVHTTSTLDLTGWRLLWCLKNLDNLRLTEFDSFNKASQLFESLKKTVGEKLSPQFPGPGQKTNSSDDHRQHPSSTSPFSGSRSPSGANTEEQQSMITKMFLQAIPLTDSPKPPPLTTQDRADSPLLPPPPPPCSIPSAKDMAALHKVLDLIQGLRQRSKTVIDCVERLRCISYDVLAQHQKTVIDFVNGLEESRLSTSQHHHRPGDQGDSSGPEELINVTSCDGSKDIACSESSSRRRSESPANLFKLELAESKPSRRGISSPANGCRRR